MSPQAGPTGPNYSNSLQRISCLLALFLVKGQTQMEQVKTLTAAGFKPGEISNLTAISAHQVSVLLHQSKQKRGSKKSKAKERVANGQGESAAT